MRIAVAGGTGTVGHHVVEIARERGHEVVVLSRSAGIDVVTGAGLDAALAGVAAVVDVSNVVTTSGRVATEFFTTATRSLLAAEATAGVGHHVALSIVGVDRAPYDYYAGKLAQERAVAAGSVPFTILRATQFHEFAEQMLERTRFAGIALAPAMRTQPLAARTVAERLVELAEGAPPGSAPDLAGPREERLDRLMRATARAEGLRGPVIRVALPGKFFAAMRDGAVLPGLDAQHAGPTFDEWLAARPR